jgi:hypothetical protein
VNEDTQSDGLGFISDGRSDRVSIDRTRALSNDLIGRGAKNTIEQEKPLLID